MDANTTNTDQETWKVIQSDSIKLTPAEKNMIAGGLAGCLGKTMTAPLSRLTVLSQVSSLFPKDHPHHSTTPIGHKFNIFGDLRRIVKQQGVLSLWNGNWTSVLHRFPYSAINFSVFEATNDHLSRITGKTDTPTNRFIAGAASGAAACFVCYPLDLVRTRLTVANSFSGPGESQRPPGTRIYGIVKDIIIKEGVGGLYRGLPVSLFVTAPTLAISFSIYGFVKGRLLAVGGMFVQHKEGETKLQRQQGAPHLSAVGSLCAGCLSGIASSCAIFPIDVVRKRMQVMGQLLPLNPTTAAVAAEVSGQVASAEEALHIALPEKRAGAAAGAGAGTGFKTIPVSDKPALTPTTTTAASASQSVRSPSQQGHVLSASANTFQQARHIFRTEGVRGFYRGLAPELLKVCPMVAIMYCSYEVVQDALNEQFPSR